MIYTMAEIDREVYKDVDCTWVKHKNLQRKMVNESNSEVNEKIEVIKKEVKRLRAQGVKQWDLCAHYSNITNLELRLLT
tara:strand:- start:239 stop:475 length:237 start_codon:yes stop_codon:yes gene_type:complete